MIIVAVMRMMATLLVSVAAAVLVLVAVVGDDEVMVTMMTIMAIAIIMRNEHDSGKQACSLDLLRFRLSSPDMSYYAVIVRTITLTSGMPTNIANIINATSILLIVMIIVMVITIIIIMIHSQHARSYRYRSVHRVVSLTFLAWDGFRHRIASTKL